MRPISPTLEPKESKPETVEHTPTPWRIDGSRREWRLESDEAFEGYSWTQISRGSQFLDPICLVLGVGPDATIQRPDAALIVRAVNNHDDLVAALEALIDVVEHVGVLESEEVATLEAAKRAVARANGVAS